MGLSNLRLLFHQLRERGKGCRRVALSDIKFGQQEGRLSEVRVQGHGLGQAAHCFSDFIGTQLRERKMIMNLRSSGIKRSHPFKVGHGFRQFAFHQLQPSTQQQRFKMSLIAGQDFL